MALLVELQPRRARSPRTSCAAYQLSTLKSLVKISMRSYIPVYGVPAVDSFFPVSECLCAVFAVVCVWREWELLLRWWYLAKGRKVKFSIYKEGVSVTVTYYSASLTAHSALLEDLRLCFRRSWNQYHHVYVVLHCCGGECESLQ